SESRRHDDVHREDGGVRSVWAAPRWNGLRSRMLTGLAPVTMFDPPSPRRKDGSAPLIEAISTNCCGKMRTVAPSGAAPPAIVTTTSFVAVHAAVTFAADGVTGGKGNGAFVLVPGNCGQCAAAPGVLGVTSVWSMLGETATIIDCAGRVRMRVASASVSGPSARYVMFTCSRTTGSRSAGMRPSSG